VTPDYIKTTKSLDVFKDEIVPSFLHRPVRNGAVMIILLFWSLAEGGILQQWVSIGGALGWGTFAGEKEIDAVTGATRLGGGGSVMGKGREKRHRRYSCDSPGSFFPALAFGAADAFGVFSLSAVAFGRFFRNS
jgi:hypothetical protein